MKEYRADANRKEYPRLRAATWLYSIAVAALIVCAVFTLWFTGIQVSDNGMAPVFEEGDVILFDRLAKYAAMPRRGDAYAFDQEGACLGRIVGLPGDSVAMEGGRVFIGGELLDESRYATLSDWEMEEITLGQGQFFILPDDRVNAVLDPDSMVVPFRRLIGRAALRVAPLGRAAVFVNK